MPHHHKTALGLAIGMGLALLLPALPAKAQDLKFADRLPQDHYIARYSINYWIDEVQKATNNAVKITRYPSERLGKSKDMLTLTKAGVVDLGEYVPGYLGDALLLSTVAELPGLVPSACVASRVYETLAKPDAMLGKTELAQAGIRLLWAVGLPAYQLFTSKKLDTLDSFKGLKIRSSGPAMDAGLRQLGIVPIRMSAAELNESFSRGTVDGTAFPAASIYSYDLQGKTKYATQGLSFGSSMTFYGISTKVWDKLSPAVQKAMTEASAKTSKRGCELIDKDDQDTLLKLQGDGATLVKLSADEHKKFNTTLEPVWQEWAESVDKKGRPGSETLKAFRAELAKQ